MPKQGWKTVTIAEESYRKADAIIESTKDESKAALVERLIEEEHEEVVR